MDECSESRQLLNPFYIIFEEAQLNVKPSMVFIKIVILKKVFKI